MRPVVSSSPEANQLAQYFNYASLIVGALCVTLGAVTRYREGILHEGELSPLVQCLFTGFAIPKGVFLLVCAFKPKLLVQMSDHPEYLLIAAFCTIYLASTTLKAFLFPPSASASASSSDMNSSETKDA
jgi:hypothetical protein